MWKKILLGITIAICIAAGVYWFTYLKEIKTPISSGINAIPLDAALIFESKQSPLAWNKFATGNMWQELIGTTTGNKLNLQVQYIDSLLKTTPSVAKLLMNQSVFISAHNSGVNSFDFLFVYSLPNLSYQSTVTGFLKTVNNNKNPFTRSYDDVDINIIHPKNKDSLSFAFLQGILMMSSNQTLVEDAIRQLKSGVSFPKDKNFNKVISTAGKNVDGNFYVNYKKFPGLLNNFANSTLHEEISGLSDFADYSGWDVTIKPNSLLFSGFTQANDSSNSFLNLFSKQDPEEIEMTKIIPSKTAFFFFMGVSDVKAFHRNYKIYLNYKQKLQAYEQYIEETNKKYHVNIERSFLDWIKNEIALVITDPSSASIADNSYAILRTAGISDAENSLNALTDSICKKNLEKKDTAHYEEYVLTHLNLPGILPRILGWQFDKITDTYFTTIDDYVVFANSFKALKNFIHDFEHNKTLEKDKGYRSFMENISGEANIYIYAAVPRLLSSSVNFLTEELAMDALHQQDRFRKFDKIGVQFSSNKGLFYSNACIIFNSMYGHELKPEWETQLDTSFHFQPYLVTNYRSNTTDVFLQDDTNKIYLVNSEGKISWKRQLPEAIAGAVFQPVAFKNPKMQILFNTTTHLYKLDENGRDSKGFPVKFKSTVTNSINMLSYEKNGDYRIFAAFNDNTIRCFNALGAEVSGFKSLKTDNPVTLPVHYFKVNTKDYICVIDVEGKIYITDRQGEIKIKLKERFPQLAKRFFVEAGSDNEHTYLVTADSTGKVVKISLNDSKEQFRPQRFDAPVGMDYQDIDQDGQNEYVFQSGSELTIYNQQKKLVASYTFKEQVMPEPLIIHLPDGSSRIGAVSSTGNLVYLLNATGTPITGFPVKGKTRFTIGDLTTENLLYLITGSADNRLISYPLE